MNLLFKKPFNGKTIIVILFALSTLKFHFAIFSISLSLIHFENIIRSCTLPVRSNRYKSVHYTTAEMVRLQLKKEKKITSLDYE